VEARYGTMGGTPATDSQSTYLGLQSLEQSM